MLYCVSLFGSHLHFVSSHKNQGYDRNKTYGGKQRGLVHAWIPFEGSYMTGNQNAGQS